MNKIDHLWADLNVSRPDLASRLIHFKSSSRRRARIALIEMELEANFPEWDKEIESTLIILAVCRETRFQLARLIVSAGTSKGQQEIL